MQYLMLIYGSEQAFVAATKEATREMEAAFGAYTREMKAAGVHVASNRLRPTDTAQTVRRRDGKTSTVDGPFAETKEQLGGFYLIEVPDAEAARSWAARCPGATHRSIELRPIWPT